MSTSPIVTKAIVEDVHELIKNTPTLQTEAEKEQFKTIVTQQNGLEVLSEDLTPLFRAVEQGRVDHIEVLIAMGADFVRKCQYKTITEFLAENSDQCVKMCKTIRHGVAKRGGPEGIKENFEHQKITELFDKEKKFDPEELFATVTSRLEMMTTIEISTSFQKFKEPNKDYVLFSFRDPVTDEFMENPGKFDGCKNHIACFDVKAFIIRNKAELRKPRPYLKCPIKNCNYKTTKISGLNVMKFFSKAFTDLGQPEKIHVFKNGKYIDPYRTKPDTNGSSGETVTPETSSQPASQSQTIECMKSDPDATPRTTLTSNVFTPTVPTFEFNSVPPATRVSTSPQEQEEAEIDMPAMATEAQEESEELINGDPSDSPSPEPQVEPPCPKDLENARLTKLVFILGEQAKISDTACRAAQAETQKQRKAETKLRYELIKCQNDRTKAKKEFQKQIKELQEELNTLKRRSSLDEEDVKAELAYANAKILRYEAERSQIRNLLKEEDCKDEPLALPSPVKETVHILNV